MSDLAPMADIWAVIPAAGRGVRAGHALPKQYLELDGRTILAHAIERLRAASIGEIVIAVAPGDDRWRALPLAGEAGLHFIDGGDTRLQSVLCGVRFVAERVRAEGWVMVHDAVRPCVRSEEITRLVRAVEESAVGGLLATRVTDTLKVAREGARGSSGERVEQVESTPDRSRYWRAQTPQLFRLGVLATALERAAAERRDITDEAAAVELLGEAPLLVEGREDNIKITLPRDLDLARYILARQREEIGDGRGEGVLAT